MPASSRIYIFEEGRKKGLSFSSYFECLVSHVILTSNYDEYIEIDIMILSMKIYKAISGTL